MLDNNDFIKCTKLDLDDCKTKCNKGFFYNFIKKDFYLFINSCFLKYADCKYV